MDLQLPILSIRQPWAWLIANGYKDIENRDWYTSFRGRFLIHAGKKIDEDYLYAMDTAIAYHSPINFPRKEDLQLGGIVGEAEIVDCVSHSNSHWFCGKYGFVIRNAIVLPFYPCKGQLGFFRLENKGGEGE